MGYDTTYEGQFKLDRPLSEAQVDYLMKFRDTRRMKRDPEKLKNVPDPIREAVGLPIGHDGAYFVGYDKNLGQDETPDIINYNSPPKGQPSLWCQWIPQCPRSDFDVIEWDGGEKFDGDVEWIEYLIEHFLAPWGYTLNGEVKWWGEDREDFGIICIENNNVTIKQGVISYV